MHGSIRILIPSNLTLHTTVESESKADKTRALNNTWLVLHVTIA